MRPPPAASAAGAGRRAARAPADAAPAGAAAARGKESAEEARRRRARLRGAEAAILRAEKRLGEIDAELAEPETYADRDVLNRLLDERANVEAALQREYAAWERLVDEDAATQADSGRRLGRPRRRTQVFSPLTRTLIFG